MSRKERNQFTKVPPSKKSEEAKEAIREFEYMRNMAEAKAYQKLSQERPLTKEEFSKYKSVCEKLGIKSK